MINLLRSKKITLVLVSLLFAAAGTYYFQVFNANKVALIYPKDMEAYKKYTPPPPENSLKYATRKFSENDYKTPEGRKKIAKYLEETQATFGQETDKVASALASLVRK